MKRTVQVYKTGQAFLGKNVADDGYIGSVDAFFNSVTIILVKPGTSLESVKRSIEIIMQDIDLRIGEDQK